MLHEAQRTDAPNSMSVSMSTAVSIVMCSDPVTRTPFNGLCGPYLARMAMSPGISCSATEISFRPSSARERSLTWKSWPTAALLGVAFGDLVCVGGDLTVVDMRNRGLGVED